jgi:acyl-CoA dehydrogenase
VLSDAQKGLYYLMQGLAEKRLISACISQAAAQRAFDVTRDFVTERKAVGGTVAQFQNTRFKLVALRTDLDMSQVFLDYCVAEHNEGGLSATLAAQAKLYTSGLEGRMTDEGVQLHGGAGYMQEYEICQLYANARISRILARTSEIMKEIITRDIFA